MSRVRWDRKLRLIMLAVLGLVAWVGVHGGLQLLAARAEAGQEQSVVANLIRRNHALEQQARSLGRESTIVRDARSLGMVRAGERAYAVTGLAGN